MDYTKLRKTALIFMNRINPTISEDFAQEYIIRCFRCGQRAKLEYVYIDYLRKEFGSCRDEIESDKYKALRNTDSEYLENLISEDRSIDDIMDMEEFSKKLKKPLRDIFVSLYVKDLFPSEAAMELGMKESTVIQLKTKVLGEAYEYYTSKPKRNDKRVKISVDNVRYIRENYVRKYKNSSNSKALAEKFGISQKHVMRIVNQESRGLK